MNTDTIRTLQRQAASAFFAAVMTLAMLANIGVLATPSSVNGNAAVLAGAQQQVAGRPA